MKTTAWLMLISVLNLAWAPWGYSQTTLTGDHLITGNLTIGSSGTPKDLLVTGGLVLGGMTAADSSIATYNSEVYTPGSMGLGMSFVNTNCGVATGFSQVYGDGDYAVAMGSSYASGYSSFAVGSSLADGTCTAALGFATASAYGSVALGICNIPTGNQIEWVATDDLMVVGNGFPGTVENEWEDVVLSNALVMRKNANMRTAGKIESKDVVRAPAGGGLSMGSFTAGQNPATLDSALKYSGE
jgi:hypothetical protein